MSLIRTADEAKEMLRGVLDGIEIMSVDERTKLIGWVDTMRNIGMWGIPGVEVMIGVHNKCVLENKNDVPGWDGADFYVAD
jgi:hypothetical protein